MVDCGDAPLTWLDNTVALKQLDLAHKVGIHEFFNPVNYLPSKLSNRLYHRVLRIVRIWAVRLVFLPSVETTQQRCRH